MVVIGGGVIGLELDKFIKRLGAEVTVVEYMDRIIPTMDAGVSKEFSKVLKKQKFKLLTSHKVKAVERNGDTVVIKQMIKETSRINCRLLPSSCRT